MIVSIEKAASRVCPMTMSNGKERCTCITTLCMAYLRQVWEGDVAHLEKTNLGSCGMAQHV